MSFSELKRFLQLALFAAALTACTAQAAQTQAPPSQPPTATPTPTLTPIPLALSVNGEGISAAEFEAEVKRYQQAQTGLGIATSLEAATQAVSDEMVDLLLLGQGAAAKGYQVDETVLQQRLDELSASAGGAEALSAWQRAHGYTEDSFKSDLRRQMAAAYMRDQIAASVPPTTEQVHVKHILLYNSETAAQALGYLKAGWKFDDLAARYDPVAKGELGWFPRGYLDDPAIEATAFALQPGQYSEVVQAHAGYVILFVAERDPARPLAPDARLFLQKHALQDWLAQQRNESKILYAP